MNVLHVDCKICQKTPIHEKNYHNISKHIIVNDIMKATSSQV